MSIRVVGKRKPAFEKLDRHIRIGRSTMRASETLHGQLLQIAAMGGNTTMLCALRAAAFEGAPIVIQKMTQAASIVVNAQGEIGLLLEEYKNAADGSAEEALLAGLLWLKGMGWRNPMQAEQRRKRA
jgi:hypothetical protein